MKPPPRPPRSGSLDATSWVEAAAAAPGCRVASGPVGQVGALGEDLDLSAFQDTVGEEDRVLDRSLLGELDVAAPREARLPFGVSAELVVHDGHPVDLAAALEVLQHVFLRALVLDILHVHAPLVRLGGLLDICSARPTSPLARFLRSRAFPFRLLLFGLFGLLVAGLHLKSFI